MFSAILFLFFEIGIGSGAYPLTLAAGGGMADSTPLSSSIGTRFWDWGP
jgi:hypothetical protein